MTLEIAKQEWDAEKSKLNDLYQQRAEVETRLNELAGLTVRKDNDLPPITQAAIALLHGEDMTPIDLDAIVAERSNMQRQRLVLNEAIKLQVKIIEDARNQYSMALGKVKRPEYVKLLKRHAAALVALSKTVDDSLSFRETITAAGCSLCTVLPKINHFSRCGSLRDPWSFGNMYLRELVEMKVLSPAELEMMLPPKEAKL
jgi:hypothetical protein